MSAGVHHCICAACRLPDPYPDELVHRQINLSRRIFGVAPSPLVRHNRSANEHRRGNRRPLLAAPGSDSGSYDLAMRGVAVGSLLAAVLIYSSGRSEER